MPSIVTALTLNAFNFSLSPTIAWNSGSGQSDRVAFFLISGVLQVDDTGVTIDNLEYNNVAATKAAEIVNSPSGQRSTIASLWYLVNPATGTNDVTYDVSGTTEVENGRTVFFLGQDFAQTNVLDVSDTLEVDGSSAIQTIALNPTVADGLGIALISTGVPTGNTVTFTFASPLVEQTDNALGGSAQQLSTGTAIEADTGATGSRDYSATPSDGNQSLAMVAAIFKPVVTGQNIAVGTASETDAAQPATPLKSVNAGIATETDQATAITPSKTVSVGPAVEIDTAIGGFLGVPDPSAILTGQAAAAATLAGEAGGLIRLTGSKK